MLKLYDDELCGESYKVRLMLGLLDVSYEKARIELYPSRQNETRRFRAMSPLGTLPVLDADGALMHDAHAILVYLARRYGSTGSEGQAHWLPLDDPLQLAHVHTWLGFAAQLSDVVFPLRAQVLHGAQTHNNACRTDAKKLLRIADETCWFNEAAGTPFVCATSAPTVADIACFVPVALLDEAGIESIDYPALRRWSMRIKRLEGFTTMAGVYAAV
ncbi:glutathione S-transferase family protein [Paraburkholderia sediminicola]|uniref:glutathione S-transferase family protein n=1 Tax=Paraburkholderia sediminicola TaxID=458836 RepID=UPI0038B9CE47